jgi:hypothetical protein
MSTVVADTLDGLIKRVSRLKEPDWNAPELSGGTWPKVSAAAIKALDEAKGHGVDRPLAALQEMAFHRAMKKDAHGKEARPLHTVALWLTDTRIKVERYGETKSDYFRGVLERRGVLKKKRQDGK